MNLQEIDFSPYAFTLDDRGWHMDDTHIRMILREILDTQPRLIIEIGSYKGRSAVAYLEAQKRGWEGHMILCDIKTQPELRKLVKLSEDPNKITIAETEGWKACFDFCGQCDMVVAEITVCMEP